MSPLDDLAPDQRAVLQLVLQRGRSYDEIAQLLSIDRAAVRQRALDAFDALTPATVLPGPEQALVTDYLLGQLPEKVAEQVYSFLQVSDADRAWALAIVNVITPLVSHSLPEIPVGASLSADDVAAGGLERDSDSLAAAAAIGIEGEPYDSEQAVPSAPDAETLLPPVATATWQDPEFEFGGDGPREDRPSSRRGGAILLVIVAVVIAGAVVIAVATSGGPAKHPASAANTTTAGQTTHTGTTSTTGTTSSTATTTAPQPLAQLNLTSPTGASSTLGIAQVVRVAGVIGVVIDAQGVPPNTSHNAYAVWLYNSPSSHKFVGFVPNLVGRNGRLATEGQLPADAASYHRLLITLETQSKPTRPGEVVLSGRFTEHS